MQILITHGSIARTRVLHIGRWQLLGASLALVTILTLLSGTIYHFVFLKAAREGWPLVSQVMKLVVRDELAQRDRFMRENLDAMARKVGEMQAKLIKLEAIGERVSGMAGVKPDELIQVAKPVEVGGVHVQILRCHAASPGGIGLGEACLGREPAAAGRRVAIGHERATDGLSAEEVEVRD